MKSNENMKASDLPASGGLVQDGNIKLGLGACLLPDPAGNTPISI